MAKRFDTGDPHTPLAWALEECEDVLIIDAYLEIKDRLAKRAGLRLTADQLGMQRLVAELDQHYFGKGNGIADKTLIKINNILGALYLEKIELINGHSTDYSLMRGVEKAERRRKIRENLKTISEQEREEMVDEARNRARMVVARRDLEVATERPLPFLPSPADRAIGAINGVRIESVQPFTPAPPQPAAASKPAPGPPGPPPAPTLAAAPSAPAAPTPAAAPSPPAAPSLEEQIRSLIRARLNDQDRTTLIQILNLMK